MNSHVVCSRSKALTSCKGKAVLVVPTPAHARALSAVCNRWKNRPAHIISLRDFSLRFCPANPPPEISARERQAIIRSILLSAPKRFDRFLLPVSKGNEPTIGAGMLRRLSTSIELKMRGALPSTGVPADAQRQFETLAQEYSARLASGGAISIYQANLQAARAVTSKQFAQAFPSCTDVLFEAQNGAEELVSAWRASLNKCGIGTALLAQESRQDVTVRHVVRASTRQHELRTIASLIRCELDAGRLQPSQCAVTFPDPSGYAGFAIDTFHDFGLEVADYYPCSIAQHPLVQLISAVRGVLASGWTAGELRRMASLPLTGAGEHTTLAEFDRVLRELGCSDSSRDEAARLRARISALKQRVVAVDAGDDESLDDSIRSDLSRYERLERWFQKLESRLSTVSSGDAQALSGILELIAPPPADIGGSALLREFTAVRETIFEAAANVSRLGSILGPTSGLPGLLHGIEMLLPGELSFAPGNADAVLMLPIDVAPAIELQRLFVVGTTESAFPRPYGTWNEETERAPATATERRRREQDLFCELCSCAGQTFFFVPETDDGTPLIASWYLENSVAPEIKADELTGSAPPSATEQLLAITAEPPAATRVSAPPTDLVLHNAAWNITAQNERLREDALGSFDGLICDQALHEVLTRRTRHHVYSAKQLEVLVQCPFRYLLERLMHIVIPDSESEEDPSPLVVGQVLHDVLCRFYSRWTQEIRQPLTEEHRTKATDWLERLAFEAVAGQPLSTFARDLLFSKLTGYAAASNGTMGSAIVQSLSRHRGMLGAFLDCEIQRNSEFPRLLQPSLFEVEFGLPRRSSQTRAQEASPQQLTITCNGETIGLRGRIDRIDSDGKVFLLLDYKTGQLPTMKSQREGLRVQIPLYLLAMEQGAGGIQAAAAGGMFYCIRTDAAEMAGRFVLATYREVAGIGPRLQCLSPEQYGEALDALRQQIANGIRNIRNGRFHLTQHEREACKYCLLLDICKRDPDRASQLIPLLNGSNDAFD